MAPEKSKDMERMKFYTSDILARLFIDIFHLTPIRLALISAIISIGYGFLFSLAGNVFTLFLQDWRAYVYSLFFTPVLMGYYLWGSNAIEGLIEDIRKSKVVDISDSDVRDILNFYQNPWRIFLSLSVAIILSVMYFISRSEALGWTSSGMIPKLSSTVAIFIGYYLAIMLSLTLITNVWALHHILHYKKFHLNPLHPDRCGGLKTLSEYSLKTAYLAAVAAFAFGLTLYNFRDTGWYYWILVVYLPLYIALTSICFFAPLITAHARMKEAKDEILSSIASSYQEDYLNAQKELNKKAARLSDIIAKIQQEKILYDLTIQFPTWPFDIETLKRLLLSLIAPILPFILSLLFDFLKSNWVT